MIAGIFHQGSGLGNQLHRYVATRVLAEDKGYEWAMINPNLFKGSSFMNLELPALDNSAFVCWNEKKTTNKDGVDIREYDTRITNVQDGTIIEGEFQDELYWKHKEDEVREWLKVEEMEMPDDVCVINFRGGEYTLFPDLFLTKDYWESAIEAIQTAYPNITFEVHTDDPQTASQFFPDYDIISDMATNWRAIRYAKHLILSNSSFAILPAWLNQDTKEVIAPKYWARHNKGFWALPQNQYSRFTYI